METLEELKAIIAGKPEGADYITLGNKYIQIDGMHCRVFNSLGVWSVPVCNTSDIFIDDKPRLLSDIERIIELMEIVEDAAALGFLTPSFDSGVSHKQLCKKYDALK